MTKRNSGGSKGIALKSPPTRSRKKPEPQQQRNVGSVYAVHPGIAMLQKWIGELKTRTGRSREEWLEQIRCDGPATASECREWLKSDFSLGTNAARWLTDQAFGDPLAPRDDTPEGYLALAPQYVELMYAGSKSAIRPIHDAVINLVRLLGEDVKICPCETLVPFYRRHVFAQVKPASAKRIDLGFALGEEPFTARLRDTGGLAKKDRITHRVALTSLSDIDLQVKRWLKQAYERAVS